jgi:photosystem II stability/assembly factor-like uncharacterized protein
MSRKSVSTVSAMLIGAVASAQSPDVWIRQSAIPTDRNPMAVFAFSPTRAIVVGDDRLILETSSAGASWITRNLESTDSDPHYAVTFPTANVGIITHNNGAKRTTDGGATWNPVANFPAGSWYHLDFLDASVGFVGGNGGFAATADGGATWQLRSGYPNCPVIFGMDFRDGSVGLVGGVMADSGENGIFKTTDGGRTWSKKTPTSANDVIWMTSTRAIADEGTTIRHSLDSGETWQTIAFGVTTGLFSMARAGNSNVLLGVSGKGDVWRSPDGGFTWIQTLDGPGAFPDSWEIHFADEQHGWVVGTGGFLYYTADGGVTWQQKNSGCNAQVLDIHMLNSNYGLAVAQDGYVFRTTNGGQFWEVQKLEVTGQVFGRDEGLRAVDIVNEQFAAAAGPGGTVFKTTNGGQTWTSIGFPNLSGLLYIYDVDFIDANVGYVYGVDQDLGHTRTLFKTTDGGESWQWVSLGERGGGTTIQFVDAQHGWLTADNNFGLRTIDGGATWIEFNMPTYFVGPEVSKVRFLDANQGWVVGWDGYVAKTLNGGSSWNLINIGSTQDHLFDVVPVSGSEIWLCGREDWSFAGVIYRSTNGGQSWTRQVVTNWFYYPYRIAALPTGEAWFGGFFGSIFKRAMPTTTLNPASFAMQPGFVSAGGLADLFTSDNSYLVMDPASVDSKVVDPIQLETSFTLPTASPTSIEVVVESKASPGRPQQTVEVWNFAQNRWEFLNSVFSNASDSVATLSLPAPLNRFVNASNRSLKVRVKWRQDGVAPRRWNAFADRINVRIGQ